MNDTTDILQALGVPMKDQPEPPNADDGDPAQAGPAEGADAPGQLIRTDWVYDQSSGKLAQDPVCYVDAYAASRRGAASPQAPAGSAGGGYAGNYAGRGPGLNNPDMDRVDSTGPLPRGGYSIGPIGSQPVGPRRPDGGRKQLPSAMRLTPLPSNDMKGRSGFLMHGGNMTTQSSSEGCIVAPPNVRKDVGGSGDWRLWVVPRMGPWT